MTKDKKKKILIAIFVPFAWLVFLIQWLIRVGKKGSTTEEQEGKDTQWKNIDCSGQYDSNKEGPMA